MASTVLGLLTLAIALILTGLLLHGRYVPTVAGAYPSVSAMYAAGAPGWIARFHEWGTAVFLIVGGASIALLVFTSGYKSPNEWRWWSLLALFGAVFGLQVTGHLLPFDRHGVQTASIEAGVGGRIPFMGTSIRETMLQGSEVSTATLEAWYLVHRWVLPMIVVAGVIAGIVALARRRETKPNLWITLGLLLATSAMATFVPAAFGSGATAIDLSSYDARPNWYTWPLHGALKLSERIGPNWSWIGVALVPGVLVAFLVALPWIARKLAPFFVGTIFVGFLGFFAVAGILYAGRIAPPYGNQDPSATVLDMATGEIQPIRIELAAQGEQIFAREGCGGCHTIDRFSGSGGPNLNRESAKHPNPQWLVRFIANPASVRPSSTMPSFGHLSQSDLAALAEFVRQPRR